MSMEKIRKSPQERAEWAEALLQRSLRGYIINRAERAKEQASKAGDARRILENGLLLHRANNGDGAELMRDFRNRKLFPQEVNQRTKR